MGVFYGEMSLKALLLVSKVNAFRKQKQCIWSAIR